MIDWSDKNLPTLSNKRLTNKLLESVERERERGCRSFKFLDGRWPHGGSCRVWWRVLNSVHPLSISPSKSTSCRLSLFFSFIVFFPTCFHQISMHPTIVHHQTICYLLGSAGVKNWSTQWTHKRTRKKDMIKNIARDFYLPEA